VALSLAATSLASLAPFLAPPEDPGEPDTGAWLSARDGAAGSGLAVGGWNSTGAGGWNSAAGTAGAAGPPWLRSPAPRPPGELSLDALSLDALSAGALALEVLSFDDSLS
jgi:hypothetical protein